MISDNAIAAIIAAFATMYVGTLPVLFSARKHAKTSAEQTRNNHSSNMRDDIDVALVGIHNIHDALGLEDRLVRERVEAIRARRKDAPS